MGEGLLAGLLLAAVACSPAPTELKESAEAALQEGRYDDARSFAERGLEAGHDLAEFDRWTLNRVRLEALAATTGSATVVEEVDALAPAFRQRVDSALWVRLGRTALTAGSLDTALELIAAGHTRYPGQVENFKIVLLDIKAAAEAANDDASLERLEQIPYLR